ncbi:odorant-binding protein 59a [Anastrepha obliqua]|uniref:odorant-binding protein 59a n=1 Tax=Anastrepha obliqua TaxID=95512 RepID=UPI00240937A8|nr:odorant-binding protein 59a [Anastrepha obliqua]
MSKRSLVFNFCCTGISVLLLVSICYALKCRTDDGPSEVELKRITRSCMRKIGENAHSSKGGSKSSSNNRHYGPLHQSNFGAQYNSNSSYDYNYDYEDDDNDRYNSNNNNYNNKYNNNNYNYNNGNYERDQGNRNALQQRNRERQQNNRGDSNRSVSSASSAGGNNNGGRHENGNGNGGSGGGNGSGSGSGNSQRSYGQRNSNSNNNNKSSNNDTADAACVVHCFFEEMNMLNSDDYPDRYKVQYGLTRDMRDRELRNFYTDTIQDCFHYLESQRRRDKCHYSRDLINCMSEYAKVNCDDWQEFNMVFN